MLKAELDSLKKDMKRQTEELEDERNESEKKSNEILQLKASVQMLKSEMRSQKAIVHGDALKYKSTNQKLMDELFQYKTRESKLKAQKTVLVREVKSLRNKLSVATNKSAGTLSTPSEQEGQTKGDIAAKNNVVAENAKNNVVAENDDVETVGEIQARGWS